MMWFRRKLIILVVGITLVATCTQAGHYKMEGRFNKDGHYMYSGVPAKEEFEGLTQEQAIELAKEYMDKQGPAAEASSRLTELFEVGEGGTWVYPSDYAGSYIDDYILHICLTSTDSEMLKPYVMCLGESIQAVCFHEVKYSYTELQNKLDDFLQFLLSKKIGFTEAYVRVEDNSILIRTTQKNLNRVRFWSNIKGLGGLINVYESECANSEATLRGGDAWGKNP